MYGNVNLEKINKLTEFDYKFLKGDEEFWSVGGAALNCVYEDCKNNGLGGFGDPTDKGLQYIRAYEHEHVL